MKKIALMILLTVAVATVSNAQTPIRIGGHLGYASDIEQPAHWVYCRIYDQQ